MTGTRLKRRLRKLWRSLVPDNRASDGFREAVKTLGPGDVAIDCGANVGTYTAVLAHTGATVHAFEPDPVAFAALESKFRATPNVTLHHVAVSDSEGVAKLYFHAERDADPAKLSQSSSLDADKPNVDASSYAEVRTIDFAAFVQGLGKVALLKMDIEGHEIPVLNHLIERGGIDMVGQAFVELHDRKNPALKGPTDALRARIATLGVPFDLTWH